MNNEKDSNQNGTVKIKDLISRETKEKIKEIVSDNREDDELNVDRGKRNDND